MHEDEDFSLRILLKAKDIYILPLHFYGYRIRSGSITKKSDKSINSQNMIQFCNELIARFDKVEDDELRSLLKNYITTKFIHAMDMGKVKKLNLEDFKKFFNASSTYKNKIRMIILLINPKIYYMIKSKFKISI